MGRKDLAVQSANNEVEVARPEVKVAESELDRAKAVLNKATFDRNSATRGREITATFNSSGRCQRARPAPCRRSADAPSPLTPG